MKKKATKKNTGPVPSSKSKYFSIFDFFISPKRAALFLVFFAIIFNAVFLWPEAAISTWRVNDDVLHLTATQEASLNIRQNLDPTDFWLSSIDLGLPLFHYYQHLPQLVLAALDQVTSSFLPLSRLFDISRYLLLVFFPLSVFWAMRRFEFDELAAGFSALITSQISVNGLLGFEYFSYIWRGWGLYTQLWAMFFLPLALAEIYRTIRKKGGWFFPVLLSTIVILSNLMTGLILVVSAAIFIFLTPEKQEIISRLKRSAIMFILTCMVTCYFFIPVFLDRAYLNRSLFLDSFIYNSFGAVEVLKGLFTGNLLDYGRLPVLTILFFLAALFVIREWKREQYRLVICLTVFWLILFFGRPTWNLMDILPFGHDIQYVRFIAGFQLGAIMLTGAGLSLCWQWVKKKQIKSFSFKSPLLVVLALLLILTPVFLERVSFYQKNTQWITETHTAFLSKSDEISEINETLNNLPPGRVYAGLNSDFGNMPSSRIGPVPLYAIFPRLGIDSFGFAYSGFDLVTDVRLMFNNTKPEQYNLFNIRYVLLNNTRTAPIYYSKLNTFEDFTLYQVSTTGYFDLVDVPAIFYGDKYSFYYPNAKWLLSSLPKQKQHPIVELSNRPENIDGLPVFSFKEVNEKIFSDLNRQLPVGGEIFNETVSQNEYRAYFTANRECYLMLKTNYAPGWNVTLDNKTISPVMVSPGFIAIKVEPGTHQALFSYHPPSYRFPLFILGAIVLLLLGFYQLNFFEKFVKRLTIKK